MSNALLRQLTMLRHIPRFPGKIGTHELMAKLEAEGFQVGQRSIQRDLKNLAKFFPDLKSDGNRDAAGWYWEQGAEIHDFPAIDPKTALTFKLAETFLSELIPPTVMDILRPYLDSAGQVLSKLDTPGYGAWPEKVRIIPRTQPLIPATIDAQVLQVIYDALLHDTRFRGRYRPRYADEAEYDFNPLGLVFRGSVIYLVATVWDYQDPRHYALHRFTQCERLGERLSRPEGFSLDSYIGTGTFQYADQSKDIKVTLLFSAGVAIHLQETPLSEDQQITQKRDGRTQITATVKDSDQLRWWLLGFGDQVEVVKPKRLRDEFRETVKRMNRLYRR